MRYFKKLVQTSSERTMSINRLFIYCLPIVVLPCNHPFIRYHYYQCMYAHVHIYLNISEICVGTLDFGFVN